MAKCVRCKCRVWEEQLDTKGLCKRCGKKLDYPETVTKPFKGEVSKGEGETVNFLNKIIT